MGQGDGRRLRYGRLSLVVHPGPLPCPPLSEAQKAKLQEVFRRYFQERPDLKALERHRKERGLNMEEPVSKKVQEIADRLYAYKAPEEMWIEKRPEVSPATCKHRNQMFLQGSRGAGVGHSERSNVSVCRDCGSFIIFKYENGAHFNMDFVLSSDEALEVAGTWVRFLQACEKERGKEMSQQPTIGRQVHYVCEDHVSHDVYPGEPKAATVVHVHPNGACDLQVMYAAPGVVFTPNVIHDEDKSPNSWHWPARV